MKLRRAVCVLVGAMIASAAVAYSQQPQNPGAPGPSPTAEPYVFVFLKHPPNPPQLDKDAAQKLQDAHMANIRKLYGEGKLVLAGPFTERGELAGIFIFKANSIDEAKQWTESDPAIQQHRLAPEYHVWPREPGTFSKPPETNPMEDYSLVVYRNGPKFQPLGPALMPLAQRHLAYMRQMASEGKLVAAGPFRGEPATSDLVGVYFVPGKDKDAAQQIVAHDPFVAEGEVTAEVHPWMGQKGVLQK